MKNTVQTVKGPISPNHLGKTMTHEHILWDQTCWWQGDPEELTAREKVHQPVCMENLGWIYYNAHRCLDNIRQADINLAIEEVKQFKRAGGDTIVDVTSIGLGRDPRALLAISEETGVNIVMGAGYYIATSHPPAMKQMSKEAISEVIVKELAEGIGDTGVKPGVIGEIGISDFNNAQEIKMLQAAAIAQRQMGVPLYIHPPIYDTKANDILDIVEKEGASLSKVIMCHCDPTLDKPDYHDSIAKRGAFIEFDQFGIEFLAVEGVFLPRDIDRIRAVAGQIERGNLKNLIVSQDICFKICLMKYGGWGYGHILRDIAPFMLKEGITKEALETILLENPKRLLTIA